MDQKYQTQVTTINAQLRADFQSRINLEKANCDQAFLSNLLKACSDESLVHKAARVLSSKMITDCNMNAKLYHRGVVKLAADAFDRSIATALACPRPVPKAPKIIQAATPPDKTPKLDSDRIDTGGWVGIWLIKASTHPVFMPDNIIEKVEPDSPAQIAGLRAGDIIRRVNGKVGMSVRETNKPLQAVLNFPTQAIGRNVNLTIERAIYGARKDEFSVTLKIVPNPYLLGCTSIFRCNYSRDQIALNKKETATVQENNPKTLSYRKLRIGLSVSEIQRLFPGSKIAKNKNNGLVTGSTILVRWRTQYNQGHATISISLSGKVMSINIQDIFPKRPPIDTIEKEFIQKWGKPKSRNSDNSIYTNLEYFDKKDPNISARVSIDAYGVIHVRILEKKLLKENEDVVQQMRSRATYPSIKKGLKLE